MDQNSGERPTVLLLWFEQSLYRFFTEILALEGYPTIGVRTAEEALNICERDGYRCVVLIDNYHVNGQATIFAKTVFARPELHARVKVVGLAAWRWEDLLDLDAYIRLPFTVEEFYGPIERLDAELQAGQED
jgi:hypothetical protein